MNSQTVGPLWMFKVVHIWLLPTYHNFTNRYINFTRLKEIKEDIKKSCRKYTHLQKKKYPHPPHIWSAANTFLSAALRVTSNPPTEHHDNQLSDRFCHRSSWALEGFCIEWTAGLPGQQTDDEMMLYVHLFSTVLQGKKQAKHIISNKMQFPIYNSNKTKRKMNKITFSSNSKHRKPTYQDHLYYSSFHIQFYRLTWYLRVHRKALNNTNIHGNSITKYLMGSHFPFLSPLNFPYFIISFNSLYTLPCRSIVYPSLTSSKQSKSIDEMKIEKLKIAISKYEGLEY